MERDFKGIWIPKEIWLNPDLSILEKCIICEIDSLDNDDEKGCFASNEYLSTFLGISGGRFANIVTDLKKKGFIFQCYFDGRIRGLRVKMPDKSSSKSVEVSQIREGRSHKYVKAELTDSLSQHSRKREHINTVYNKEDNNTIINEKLIIVSDVPFSEVEKKGKKNKKEKIKPEPSGLHQEMLKIYHDWYKQRNDDIPPNITPIQGKAMKELIAYFKNISRAKNVNWSDEEINKNVLEIFNYILSKWDELDSYQRKQTKLNQISSNIQNILDWMKNGKKKTESGKPEEKGKIQKNFESTGKALNNIIQKYENNQHQNE